MNFLLTLLLLGLSTGLAQNSTNWPVAHPGTEIFFQVEPAGVLRGSPDASLELLSAPPNVMASLGTDRGLPVLVIQWHVSADLLGTNATFVVRATDLLNPSLHTTNIVEFAVQDPPPIHSIQMSNGLPVLTLTNLPPTAGYQIEFASSVPSTNWTLLATTAWHAPAARLVDLSAPSLGARFYRLRPVPVACSTSSCP